MNVANTLRSSVARGLVAATATVSIALVGCGSSKPSSTITVGADSNSPPASTAASPTATTSGSGQTPTSGVLSLEPKIAAPGGAAPSTLVVKDLVSGNGAAAKAGDNVTVNYVGVLFHGGKVFDASWNRKQPLSFTLGQGMVIPGWDQGVAGMKVGGRRELIVPASLAYGAAGRPPTIPANSPLVFVVDLLEVQRA